MDDEYTSFFKKVSEIYNSPGGYNILERAIKLGTLRNELNEKEYSIAEKSLLEFFQEHNTNATNRIFSMGNVEIKLLVNKCREIDETY